MKKEQAIIIGAGPAGITAAYELLDKTDILPVIFELSNDIGGLSKTVDYKGNKIDIGGHRFFSKLDIINKWWLNILPLQGSPAKDDKLLNRKFPENCLCENGPNPDEVDNVMLYRNRISRIFYMKKFFDYPIKFSFNTFLNLGLFKTLKISFSYLKTQLSIKQEEKNLKDFIINRFGKELYQTFFKDYTEKVWGVSCEEIQADWGKQRIKGLSLLKAVNTALRKLICPKSKYDTETSLIDSFLYPKYGPGQLWEEAAAKIIQKGGEINLNCKIIGLKQENNKITEVTVRNEINGEIFTKKADYFFSTMPIKDLINSIEGDIPEETKTVANGLIYRDFITIGLLLNKLQIKNNTKIKTINDIIPDTWIYMQDKDVKIGRIQIFNNWSPYLIKNSNLVWIGLEYFCNDTDDFWNMNNSDIIKFAQNELCSINFIDEKDIIDSTVIKYPKAYPCYFGTYNNFEKIKSYTNSIENLYLIGRNGMHKYNNMDHSMLSAITAVSNIKNNVKSKDNIWNLYTESQIDG